MAYKHLILLYYVLLEFFLPSFDLSIEEDTARAQGSIMVLNWSWIGGIMIAAITEMLQTLECTMYFRRTLAFFCTLKSWIPTFLSQNSTYIISYQLDSYQV